MKSVLLVPVSKDSAAVATAALGAVVSSVTRKLLVETTL